MSLRELSFGEGVSTGLLTAAGFAIGYATPLGGFIVLLMVVLIAIDAFFESTGSGLSTLFASGLSKVARLARSAVDAATSSPLRIWAWRAPGLATVAGFLLAWAQSYAGGA